MFHRPETNPASQDMLVGGVNPSEKYESQLGSLFPTEWKVIKVHGSNHQPNKVITCHNNNIGSKPKPKILAPNSPNSPNGPGTCHPLPVSLSWGQVVNGGHKQSQPENSWNGHFLGRQGVWHLATWWDLDIWGWAPNIKAIKNASCSLQHFVCENYWKLGSPRENGDTPW